MVRTTYRHQYYSCKNRFRSHTEPDLLSNVDFRGKFLDTGPTVGISYQNRYT